MTHFWEDPSFIDKESFKRQVLDVLENGYFSSHYKGSHALVPLKPLIGPGGILNPTTSPHFFVFAPKDRGILAANPGINPASVPLMYPALVYNLQSSVRDLTGAIPNLLYYDPNSETAQPDQRTRFGKVLLQ